MKHKLILRVIFLICLLSGCVSNKHKYQAYQNMKVFVLDEYNRDGGYLLFFETNTKNRITRIRANDLQYILYCSSKLKDSYFKDLMLGKIILSCEDFGGCFTPSPFIMDEYKKKGIEEFIKAYSKRDDEYDFYTINPFLSHNEQLTIAYCFYLNNIYTAQDCYSGELKSRKDLTPILAEPINMDKHLIPIEE